MKEYITTLVRERRIDDAPLVLRIVLHIFSLLYATVTGIRNRLYDRNILKARDVPCRVVSIGNLTVGGTGKTPVTIMTARILVTGGCRVAVVSRGYGRSTQETIIVSDGDQIHAGPDLAGDEPHLIAESLPGVPVVVGADRHLAAMTAYERFKPDVILLDDGFQHRRLNRQVDIVTVDAHEPYGSGYVLPRGILRESPRGLSRAQAVVVTRCNEDTTRDHIERLIRYYDCDVDIYWSAMVPSGLREPNTHEYRDLAVVAGMKVFALCNIAVPEQFHGMLVRLGASIVAYRCFEDHHRYTIEELTRIEEEAVQNEAGMIIMTAKDERNLPDGYVFSPLPVYVLDIDAQLLDHEHEYSAAVIPRHVSP